MKPKIMQKEHAITNFLSKRVPKFFGIDFVECQPIVAGGVSDRNDAAGRKMTFSEAPPSTIFYNLTTDDSITSCAENVRLNYVVGQSDAGTDERTRLDDASLIYWTELGPQSSLDRDDAVLVKMSELLEKDQYGEDIHPDWMCLRRIGNMNGETIEKETNTVFIRSVVEGEIKVSKISRHKICGKVFGRYNVKASRGVVAVNI